jgi:hypothetical protein
MRPRHLNRKQAEALQNRIRPMLSFLHRCRRRLEALDFQQECELFQSVDKAHRELHSLHVTLIYESCGRGVGEPREEEPDGA